jgi:hypothetical protein
MNPENVNPNNFKLENILFNNTNFSIAYGKWENRNKVIAMRWNGNKEDDKGFPKTFGHPMWFIIDDDIKLSILKSLVGLKNSDDDKIQNAIDEILQE